MRKFLFLFMMIPIISFAQGSMDFESVDVLTASYADGSFTENGIEYHYNHSRDQDEFPIDGNGLMLRRASDSYFEWTVPNGVGELTFQYRKAYTGGSVRQLEVLVNGDQVNTTPEFGSGSGEQDDIYTLTTEINDGGSVTIRIKNVGSTDTNRQSVIDNIEWTAFDDGGPGSDETGYGEISLGTGQSSGVYFPIYYLYDYSYTQTIYTAEELIAEGALAGTINQIAYLPTSSANTEDWTNWTIYMQNTDKDSFVDAEDWMPVEGEMIQVFEGDLQDQVTAGEWMEITLDTDFEWDGSSNILIAVVDNTDGWGSNPGWAHYENAPETGYKGVRVFRDNLSIDVDNPPTDAFGNSTSNSVARIKFSGDILLLCDEVDAGIIDADAPEIMCAGDEFELTVTGATFNQGGLTHQWQSSVNGDDWTDIEGETEATLTTSISEDTYFRFAVSCEGGSESFSDAVLVELNTNLDECRCIPSGNSSYYFSNFSTSNAVQNIDHSESGPNADGYVDLTHTTVSQEIGEEVHFEAVTAGTSTTGLAIWVDWNQTGEWEIAYNSNSFESTHTGSFEVPLDAIIGETVMRIGLSYTPSTGPGTPCGESTSFSYQDYAFEVIGVDCIKPHNIVVGDITSFGADLSWETNGEETEWEVAYGEDLSVEDIDETTTITGTPEMTLTDLEPATVYNVFVRAVCGEDNLSNWTNAFTFATTCVATDVPFLQDFEQITPPDLPLCASIENINGNDWETMAGDGTGFEVTSRPEGFSGNSLLYRYTSFGTGISNSWYFTQGINLEAGVVYKLSYKYGSNSLSYTEKLLVSRWTSPLASEMYMYVPRGAHQFGDKIAHDYEVEFTVENDGVYYFGFQAKSDANQYFMYVDDIAVDFAQEPLVCEVPENIVVNDITENSAIVSWDEGDADSWEVIYGISGFDIEDAGTSVDVDTATLELENLDPATEYDVYVRAICEDLNSDWSEVVSFTTEEEEICEVPESIVVNDITENSAIVSWDEGDADSWEVIYGISGFDIEDAGTSVDVDTATLELENLDPDTEYDVYVRAVCGDLNSDWSEAVSFTTEEEVCEIPSDIVVETNEENTDVTVSWTAGGDETQWEVIYGLTGFDIETEGTSEITDIAEIVIEGLEEKTDYDVYVRAICGDDNFSDWTDALTFTTVELGMEDIVFQGFSYYPNPVENELNLTANLEIEKVEVYNLLGQQVIQLTPQTLETSIHTEKLHSGVYLMKVQINGAEKNFRIIKK